MVNENPPSVKRRLRPTDDAGRRQHAAEAPRCVSIRVFYCTCIESGLPSIAHSIIVTVRSTALFCTFAPHMTMLNHAGAIAIWLGAVVTVSEGNEDVRNKDAGHRDFWPCKADALEPCWAIMAFCNV